MNYINLLKKWIEPVPAVSAFATVSPEPPRRVLVKKGEDLTPTQQEELGELVDQFGNVFSMEPSLTLLLQHTIKTPPGVVI